MLLACDAGEQLVVQVCQCGHSARVGGRGAAVRASALRGLLRPQAAASCSADLRQVDMRLGCSAPLAVDALGITSAGEICFPGGGVLPLPLNLTLP